MLLTCFWLNINCLLCARSAASSLSSSRTICQLTERAQPLCQCLPFQPSEMGDTFISLGLWPNTRTWIQWTTKFSQKCSSRSTWEKFVTWMDGHYGLASMALTYIVIINTTEKWCKRLRMCIHVKGRLSEYLNLLKIIHMNILMW